MRQVSLVGMTSTKTLNQDQSDIRILDRSTIASHPVHTNWTIGATMGALIACGLVVSSYAEHPTTCYSRKGILVPHGDHSVSDLLRDTSQFLNYRASAPRTTPSRKQSHEMNRIALVTGGTRGIGLALTQSLLGNGWSVYTIARGTMPENSSPHTHLRADLSTREGIEQAQLWATQNCHALDLLVNNAGRIGEDEDLESVSIDTLLSSYLLHAVAPLILTRSLAPALKARGGAVVTLDHLRNLRLSPGAGYGASKRAQSYVTQACALRLAPDVRVNALAPGHVDTSMTLTAPRCFPGLGVKGNATVEISNPG